jgi:hypothetical protein
MSTPPRLFDTNTLIDLIIQIREVDRLRDLVRKAENISAKSAAETPQKKNTH